MESYYCEACETQHKEFSPLCERCGKNPSCLTVWGLPIKFGIQDVCRNCLKDGERGGLFEYHGCGHKGIQGVMGDTSTEFIQEISTTVSSENYGIFSWSGTQGTQGPNGYNSCSKEKFYAKFLK